MRLWIDNWRWIGVPFDLRTGKGLRRDRHEIAAHFRTVPHLPFERAAPAANMLRLRFDANCIELGLNIIGPGASFDLERVNLNTQLAPQAMPEYSRLLLDVFEGDATLSIRGDEAEECWRIVEPILAEWSKGTVPLRDYPAGSDGPQWRGVVLARHPDVAVEDGFYGNRLAAFPSRAFRSTTNTDLYSTEKTFTARLSKIVRLVLRPSVLGPRYPSFATP